MELVDTHCHIHFKDYKLEPDKTLTEAREFGVAKVICVGTTLPDSQRAIDFAQKREGVWASAGVHPHDADNFLLDNEPKAKLAKLLNKSAIVAVGELGLDFYKNFSPKQAQIKALKLQIEAGLQTDLPFIFHVRDAWEDFWKIFDSYGSNSQPLRGVVHSFSAHPEQLEQALSRGLYVGLNGIMTFTTDKAQLEAAKQVSLDRLVLETDAPFLTPKPFRGEVCQPKHVRTVAEFLASLRGESLEELAKASTKNSLKLFGLDS